MNLVEQLLDHLEEGRLDQAKKEFETFLSLGSDEEKYTLAGQLMGLGFLNEAQQLYKDLLETYPEDGELAILLAETLIDMDKEEEAILYLDQIPETDPDYPRALLLLADLYQMQGLLEVSENKLLEASGQLPDEPVIHFALAEFYASVARYAEAVKDYEWLLDKGIETLGDANIHGRLAEVLSAAGAFEDALHHFEHAMEGKPGANTLFGYALTAYQAGFYRKAIELFNQLKEMDPGFQSLYLYLGRAYEHEEELKKALETVDEGIHVDEFNKELFCFGGKVALKTGREDLAEKYFREALGLDPGYIDAALAYHKLLLHQERYAEIAEQTTKMEKEGDVDPQLYWDMALSFQKLEEYSQALKYYSLAYNDLKNDPQFLSDYGYFLIEDGKREQAIEIFRSLLSNDPVNEEWVALLERLEEER
ncbi:tetratricopeptide repeat protein [Heyndrickxia acidiproducens]|uniref:tetratricopeptide repeat protein n=1 Tax=Heyndrickxia acidiproducens TaxID=1121084 RepID=UPI0003686794|nr:tetratricopeptide repeat protein [Heyndrickxia acidiproducens]